MTTQSTKEIMKLENQVCSLDLAKRLKELGVKQESLFYWIDRNFSNELGLKRVKSYILYALGGIKPGDLYYRSIIASAFTVAELGEMLPEELPNSGFLKVSLNIYKIQKDKWEIGYSQSGERCFTDVFIDTEANARAKMLVYLLETKQRIK